jgi:hypothetical protein
LAKHKPLPDQKRLHELLDYEPGTGLLYWKSATSKRLAGGVNSKGYCRIRIDNVSYKAHRIVWQYVTGEDPKDLDIDHINRNRLDNRIENLRLATTRQSNRNRTSLGICYREKYRKWQAQIRVNGKLKYLGVYDCPLLAKMAYENAAKLYFQEFASC